MVFTAVSERMSSPHTGQSGGFTKSAFTREWQCGQVMKSPANFFSFCVS